MAWKAANWATQTSPGQGLGSTPGRRHNKRPRSQAMANFSGGATNLKFGGRSLDHTFRNACARPPCVLLGEARPAQHPASLPFSPGSQPLSCPAPVRPPVRPREGAASPRPASPRSQQRSGLLRPPCPTCGAVDGGLGALVVSHPAAGSARNSSSQTAAAPTGRPPSWATTMQYFKLCLRGGDPM